MNHYKFWADSLAWLAGPQTAPRPMITNEQPECGFYRMKRNKAWVPVAVWPAASGSLGFKFGHEVVGEQIGIEQWPYYAANPITEEVYRAVCERGENWPDADPTVAAMTGSKPAPVIFPGSVMVIADSTAEFREQITTALAGVGAYAKIESDEASTRSTGLRNLLNELASTADKAREAEKAPHLKAEREIDARWQPIIKQARKGALDIKEARDRWEDVKREAARLAVARAAEEQQRLDETADHRDISEPPPEPVQARSNLPPPSTQIKPTFGKAAHVGSKMVVTAVDIEKILIALKPRPEWPAVQEFFRELAQKLANRGVILDGITAEEKANTR